MKTLRPLRRFNPFYVEIVDYNQDCLDNTLQQPKAWPHDYYRKTCIWICLNQWWPAASHSSGSLLSCSHHNTKKRIVRVGGLRGVVRRRGRRWEAAGEARSLRGWMLQKSEATDRRDRIRGGSRWIKGGGISMTIKSFLRNCKGVDDSPDERNPGRRFNSFHSGQLLQEIDSVAI